MSLFSNTYCDLANGYTTTQKRYDEVIKCAAVASNVDPHIIKEVIAAESSFDPNASGGGDTGLMQINVDTAQSLGLTGTVDEIKAELKKPCTNIEIGAKYLAQGIDAVRESLNQAGINYPDEDLRVYADVYFNAGPGTFTYAVDTAKNSNIPISSWRDFTVGQSSLNGISIMRKAVEANMRPAALASTPAKIKVKDVKKKYDKNNNGILEENEWYDWRAEKVLIQDRMKKVAEKYFKRGANRCPAGTYNCNQNASNSQCSN